MRYLPILNVWDNAIGEAIRLGQLKLQKGQWIKCGENAKPSRFILRKKGGSIWAIHPNGRGKVTQKQFKMACALWS